MSYSFTESYTYTVVDVRKVMDQVRSDLRMAAQSTGLMTLDSADVLMADVVKYAEKNYLESVLIHMDGSDGVVIRAAEYVISADGRTLTASRSGNMLWTATPGANLRVTLRTTDSYDALSPASRAGFKASLSVPWPAGRSPALGHLSGTAERNYVSNAYGARKTSYS
jgi:hypothetical protein